MYNSIKQLNYEIDFRTLLTVSVQLIVPTNHLSARS